MEAVLLGVGVSHVELLRPLAPDTAVGRFLERNGPGLHHVAYGTDDIEVRPRGRARGGARPDRRAAAHRHPGQPGGVRASEVHGRSADRTCRSCGRTLMADESRRIDIGFQGGPVLPTRVKQSSYDELHKALSKDELGPLVRAGDDRLEGLDRPVAGRVRPHRHRRAAGRLLGRPVDRALLRLLRTRGHPPALDGPRSCTRGAGENGCWRWFGVAILARDRRAVRVVLAALLANTAVKQVVRRPRRARA